MSLKDIVSTLATNRLQFQQDTLKFQQETRTSIKNLGMQVGHLEVQVGQLATIMGRLETQGSGKLPSQTVVNPRENMSAIK